MSTSKATFAAARSSLAVAEFALDLTERQRQTMLTATRLPRGITERLERSPSGDHLVAFSRRELDQIADELAVAALEASEPERKQLAAVLRKLDELIDSACREPGRSLARRRPELDLDLLLQFKVTLLDLEPRVWRRFQVEDGTLGDLHKAIQAAFDWQDQRQHRFAIEGIAYGRPLDRDFGFGWGSDCTAESTVRLSELAPRSGHRARWIYEYDSGAIWRHEVLFEGYPRKEPGGQYPVCLEGQLACPPENVDGPWGYVEFLQNLEDRKRPERERSPAGSEPFDPEAFDPQKTSLAMRNARRTSLRTG